MNQTNKRAYPPRRPGARTQPQHSVQRVSRPGAAQVYRRPMPRRGGALMPLIAFGALAVVLALVLQLLWPKGFPLSVNKNIEVSSAVSEIYSGGPIRINELMSSNQFTLSTEDGLSADWIEIINIGKSTVSLEGYSLAKKEKSVSVFRFPAITLAAGECAIVFADSRLRESADEELHAPFRLSSAGDTLMLFNPGGTAIDSVNIPALTKDVSYAREGTTQWQISDTPTPGMANGAQNYQLLNEVSADSPVIVNELMASNAATIADENNQYHDYIELYNRSGEAVSLSGWYLSDDETNARKWRFPDVTLAPGEYLLVFASGLNRKDDTAHLHASFSLSSEGEAAVLSNAQGRKMDVVRYDLLKPDVAWSRAADGSWSAALAPSPGRANQ